MDQPVDTRLLDPQVLARLIRQHLQSRHPMVGNVSGLHKSPHRGSSVEFAEYRKYSPGDDIRRLDWRVYGRTDRFFIREFEADTNLRCYLVLDCSASMSFGQPSRHEYARRLLATLAYLLVQQGDAVGLHCLGNTPGAEVPPRRNPAHLQPILRLLDQSPPVGETRLVPALHELAEKIRQRALIIIASDFFCPPEDLLNCFQHLRFQKHDVVAFHLLERRELDFDFDRPLRFIDLELTDSLLAEPAVIRKHYLEHLNEYLEELREGCHRFDVDYRRVMMDDGYEQVLADFLVDRSRFMRGDR